MNETLKGVAHIGSELAAVKADLQCEIERHRKTWRQLEQVSNAMRRIIERCEVFIDDEAEMSTASVEALMGIAEDALSLQAEPAPAQDEREAPQVVARLHESPAALFPATELTELGVRVTGTHDLMTVAQHERIVAALTRPAQTEQQPSAAQQILDLIMEECRYWHGRDEARRGNFANLYAAAKELADNAAPIAQTAPQPEQSGLVEAERDRLQSQLAETQANDRAAMGYLHDVRQLVGGSDFPEMVRNVARMVDALPGCVELIEALSPIEGDVLRKARAAMAAKEE